MRIESLRLKGFIGISRGLGLPELSINFSGINGLVAFDGINGVGKSTVLENLHPYNQLASRDGALYHHCFLRNSEKELSFTYAGHQYRTLLKIDCDSGKSEGYIWKNEQPEVNGKISEYADYIKSLLGSPALFFASVFCAQNSKKISDMTTGQIKGLFAEFLRLDRLSGYENTAKQCGNVLSGSMTQIEIRCKNLQEQLSIKPEVQAELTTVTGKIKELETGHENLKNQAKTLSTRIDELKKTSAQNAVNVKRKEDMINSLTRMRTDLEREQEIVNSELVKIRERYSEISTAIDRCNKVLTDRDRIMGAAEKEKEITAAIETITEDIEKLTMLVAENQEVIHALENAYQKLQNDIKTLDNDSELTEIKGKITETEAKIKDQQRSLKDIETDFHIMGLEAEIKRLEEKTSILTLKDPECQSKTCGFIVDALDAAEHLPTLQKELTECKERQTEQIRATRQVLTEMDAEMVTLSGIYSTRLMTIGDDKAKLIAILQRSEEDIANKKQFVTDCNNSIARLKQDLTTSKAELERQKELSTKVSEIKVAEARKADLEKQKEEVSEKGKAVLDAFGTKKEEFTRLISETEQSITAIEETIDMDAEPRLQESLDEKQAIEETQLPSVIQELQAMRDKVSQIRGDLSRLESLEREMAIAQGEKARLTKEISEWTYIRNGCSKNGLQALEIDGAAPLITGYANDLLAQAFGPLFTVRLRTQDDEGREVLDIVTIAEDGSETLLDNLSGGQKVWILMALRLAMTLLSKEKSGRNFETALFDELDGPLDPENSLNFINMYQSFMKTGGFKMIPFISHKPECRSMADHILRFEPGMNPVWG